MIMESLIAAADRYEVIRTLMAEWMEDYVRQISIQLELAYPGSTESRYQEIAYGLIGISFNHDSLVPLRMPSSFSSHARACARLLLKFLEHG